MRMDKNLDGSGGETPPRYEGPRQTASEALSEILEMFNERTSGWSAAAAAPAPRPESPPVAPGPSSAVLQLPEIIRQLSRANLRPAEASGVDGVDPSSPLGRSMQMKFSELEEISRRLKSRLDRVVGEGDYPQSPDSGSNVADSDLEWDLNTDSRADDLTPLEFSRLLESRATAASRRSVESSDRSEDVSK